MFQYVPFFNWNDGQPTGVDYNIIKTLSENLNFK